MKTKVLTIFALSPPCYHVVRSRKTLMPRAGPAGARHRTFVQLFHAPHQRACRWMWLFLDQRWLGRIGRAALAIRVLGSPSFPASIAGRFRETAALGPNLISALGGVRVARPLNKRFIPYAQGLVGVVHAFDSSFPGALGTTPSATSFALAAGGGLEVALSRRWLVGSPRWTINTCNFRTTWAINNTTSGSRRESSCASTAIRL